MEGKYVQTMANAFVNVISPFIVNDALTRLKRQPGFLPSSRFMPILTLFSSVFFRIGRLLRATMTGLSCTKLILPSVTQIKKALKTRLFQQ
jgi:hypothetical protein